MCSHEQKKCEERESTKEAKEKKQTKNNRQRESCPRKKEAKNETKIHSFSLSLLVVVFGVLP